MSAPRVDMDRITALFFEEAEEHVAAMEQGLLALERTPDDAETLASVFRAAHSLKGGSATCGLSRVATFTHSLEALLEQLRAGTRHLGADLAALLLVAVDEVRSLLLASRNATPPESQGADALARLRAALGEPAPQTAAPAAPPSGAEASRAPRTLRIEFAPARDLFFRGNDPLLVLRELSALGELSCVCDVPAVPPLDRIEPETCCLRWKMELRTACTEAEVRDAFCFVEEGSSISISAASTQEAARGPSTPMRAGESNSIRVSIEKVDRLVDLVGEMVISQATVSLAMNDTSPAGLARLRAAVSELERSTRELQERVMRVRMVPIGSIFDRFRRVVRDLAAASGKQVALEISGEDTELDKGVVERIADPLTHLVRNAVDHGVEAPADRLAAGKPAEARVRLSARTQGGNVVVEVSDDGRGLDRARIRAKAIERGLIAEGDVASPDEIARLVFLPGFSTAERITDVSGRGVGMDVVRRNVESLGGTVGLADAEPGTLCRIRLPLTMAILEGLTLRVGAQLFVVPLLSILESFRPKPDEVKTIAARGEVISLRGQTVPLLRLHALFGIPSDVQDPSCGLVTVVDSGGLRLALLTDEVVGQAQAVVKSLEKNFRRVPGVTGATILGDGKVALILDIETLARRALGKAAA